MYIKILIFTCILYASHYFLKYVLETRLKKNANSKYFLLHFITNMYIINVIYDDVKTILLNPLNYIIKTPYPTTLIMIFHLYHIIAYNNIPLDDKYHHIINVFILYPFLYLIEYTSVLNLGVFFLMGLPGGITYLLLFLRQFNILTSLTEKRISKHLNLWIRAPGIILTCVIMYINMYFNYEKLTRCYIITHILIITAIYWNAMYFTNTIVTSFARANYQKILIEKINKSSLNCDIKSEIMNIIKKK